jgi:hypothetical protein
MTGALAPVHENQPFQGKNSQQRPGRARKTESVCLIYRRGNAIESVKGEIVSVTSKKICSQKENSEAQQQCGYG